MILNDRVECRTKCFALIHECRTHNFLSDIVQCSTAISIPGNQGEVFLIFFLTFVFLFSLIIYLVRFNTISKCHFLTVR